MSDLEATLQVLKTDYPQVYIDYCNHFNMKDELNAYIKECLNMKNAGPLKLGQYIHGGLLPEI